MGSSQVIFITVEETAVALMFPGTDGAKIRAKTLTMSHSLGIDEFPARYKLVYNGSIHTLRRCYQLKIKWV